jgi:hypothetical protein
MSLKNTHSRLFPKVTEITGDGASVTSPEISMAENSAVVFLIAGGDGLTLTAKGYKGEDTEGAIGFKTKTLTDTEWTEVEADGTDWGSDEAFLVAISSGALAHDEFDRVTLTIDGDTDGKAIFAFEIGTRYIPE